MTPAQTPPPPDSAVPPLVLDHAGQLLALENAASRAAAGPLRKALVDVQRRASVLWARMFGSLESPADPIRLGSFVAEIKRMFSGANSEPSQVLSGFATKALTMGVEHAAATLGLERSAAEVEASLSYGVVQSLNTVDAAVAEHLAGAESALDRIAGKSFQDVIPVLAKANRAVTTIDRAASYIVNDSSNTSAAQLADSVGAGRLWIALPDACLSCQGMSGRVAPAGQPFDDGYLSTFTDKPTLPWPAGGSFDGPPLHPHDRCRIVPWLGATVIGTPNPWGAQQAIGGHDLPDALRREARRAVVKGWSLPSESQASRLRAADRLLARGANLPKTVQAYGRAAVRRGRFPSRSVPVGAKGP